jgi:branched-chain amino acid transport system ATP-binding protein
MNKPPEPFVLEVEAVNVRAGAVRILSDVSLTVRKAEAVAMLGPNGSGRSTMIRAIAGLVTKISGRVQMDGIDITYLAPHRVCRLGIGYVPDDRRVFSQLTVQENMEVGRWEGRSKGQWNIDNLFQLFPILGSRRHQRAGTLSGGEQQMLSLARALMGNPRLLLLDEPTAGLAADAVKKLLRLLLELKSREYSLLVAEQNPGFARQLCDRSYILEKGSVVGCEIALSETQWSHGTQH